MSLVEEKEGNQLTDIAPLGVNLVNLIHVSHSIEDSHFDKIHDEDFDDDPHPLVEDVSRKSIFFEEQDGMLYKL